MEGEARNMSDAKSDRTTVAARSADCGKSVRRCGAGKKGIKERAAASGYALIFFQIVIMLSPISAIIRKKPLCRVGLGTSAFSVIFFTDGSLLFY